jgi:hypothetical protein
MIEEVIYEFRVLRGIVRKRRFWRFIAKSLREM